MKKMVLALSLSLAALGFLVSPALAASPEPAAPVLSAEDQEFIASLAIVPAGTPAPELVAKRPDITPKATCIANCGSGTPVSCTYTGTCSATDRNCNAEQGHVTCDGSTTWCQPACPGCPPTWCTQDCSAQCDPCPGTLICNESHCTSHCKCDFIHCAM
jgi:hypothetical protein